MLAHSPLIEKPASLLSAVRVDGGVSACFRDSAGISHLDQCEERDGYKLRFPRGAGGCQGVIINTGGGVAGGDRVTHRFQLHKNAAVTLTTQAAERVYRSLGDAASVHLTLQLDDGASLDWLPQETILFNRSALSRKIEVDLAPTASLLMLEITVFGRAAMGEAVEQGSYRDRWSVRRGGALVFAEAARFEGELAASLVKPAIANGARITTLLLYACAAAQDKVDLVRNAISNPSCRIAASAWNGLLVVRALGSDLEAVRRDMVRAVLALRNQPMPRVWST
jgi:urease accessory protein